MRGFAGGTRFAALALLLAGGPALGAPEDIDATLKACLDRPEGSSTAGMVACSAAAAAAWDKRLNAVYQQAMKALDPKSQELLRASQRRWVAFREAERAAMGGPWRQDAGTLAQVLTADADMNAIKERVGELQVYLDGGG